MLIVSYLLCQMWANPPELNSMGTVGSIQFRKRNKILSLLVYVLHKMRNWALSSRCRAKTAKKCTKKCDARAKLLFCSLNRPIVFLTHRWILKSLTRDRKTGPPFVSVPPSLPSRLIMPKSELQFLCIFIWN